MSKINLTYKKVEYTLEYSRQSVKEMERQGFVAEELQRQPATMIPLLFEGAFVKNHRGLKRKLMDEIYDEIPNKMELIGALAEMYAETLTSLMDDSNGEGNAVWAMVK